MEHKTVQTFETKITDEGIVETIFAVMGNVDLGNDMIHNGAFAKTFTEHGRKVKVLDHHQAQSVRDVIGKPLELRELDRAELPEAVTDAYPEATGGAWAKVQFLMDTPEGDGAFKRIKAGVVNEWSFGYDALDADFSTVKQDEADITIRNLRTLKLYELSPVVFAMNPATTTVSAKTVLEEPVEDDPPASEPAPDDLQWVRDRFELLEGRIDAQGKEDHDAPPEGAADDTPTDDAAGPDIPPTAERMAMVETLRQEFEQLVEVE